MFLDTAFIVLLIGFLLLVVCFFLPSKSTNQMMVTEHGSNRMVIGRKESNIEHGLGTRIKIDQKNVKLEDNLQDSLVSAVTYKSHDAFIVGQNVETAGEISRIPFVETQKQTKSYILQELLRKSFLLEDNEARSKIFRSTCNLPNNRYISNKARETLNIGNFGKLAILAKFKEHCDEVGEINQIQPIHLSEITSNTLAPNRYIDIRRSADNLIVPRETPFLQKALRFMKKLNLTGTNEKAGVTCNDNVHLYYQEINPGGDSESPSQILDNLSGPNLRILRGFTSQTALQADECRTLLEIVTKFVDTYRTAIDGTSVHFDATELCGGARICNIFHETYRQSLESVLPFVGLTRTDVLTAMRNTRGTRPGLFVPVSSFELLVRKQIERLREPSLNCVQLVYEEMQRTIWRCVKKIEWKMAWRFPQLREDIIEIVSQLLNNRLHVTIAMVKDLLAIELAYINARYPDHVQTSLYTFLTEDIQKKRSCCWFSKLIHPKKLLTNDLVPCTMTKPITHSLAFWCEDKHEHENCLVIERLIVSYFLIVRKTIQDSVPKAIMHFLVNYTRDHLQEELAEQLYKNYKDKKSLI